jgi:hypothetical protein
MSARFGDGPEFELIPAASQTVDGTTPIVTRYIDMRDKDCVSLQLITEDAIDTIPVETGDEADGTTETLEFAGFDFTGLEDAIIRISGAENAENNGDHIITTGADGSAEVAGSDLVDEEFDPETVTAILIHAEDPATGTWLIEASNNYAPGGIAPYGQVSTSGDWSDVTAKFDIDTSITAASNQMGQANLRCRVLRATFTPTDGEGTVRANGNAKGWD